jgi:hypothetical protein
LLTMLMKLAFLDKKCKMSSGSPYIAPEWSKPKYRDQ